VSQKPLPGQDLNNTWTGNNTHSGTETFTGGGTLSGFSNINAVRYACSLSAAYQFQTIAAAYADTNPVTVHVCPGHAETLAANFVLNKSYSGIVFDGTATITMGSFQVTKAGAIHGVFIKGPAVPGTTQPGAALVKFVYTGTGNAIAMGDSSADSKGLDIENIDIDTGGAGANAVGLCITRTQNFILSSNTTYCGSTNQVGVLMDGTGNFTGLGDVTNPYAIACFSGLRFTGTGGSGTNYVNVHGGSLTSTPASGRALDFQNGNGNIVSIDIEGAPTAVNFAASNQVAGNVVIIWANTNTTDVAFGAGSHQNVYASLFGVPTVSDSSSAGANTVYFPGNIAWNIGGALTKYNGIATVNGGVPAEYAQVNLTAQNNNIGFTTLYTPTSSGFYRVTCYLVITTAAGTSSTLPGCGFGWTDNDTNVAVNISGISPSPTTNTIGTYGQGTAIINAKSGVAITYQTTGYASNAANAMQYAAHFKIEAM
jgi:hypothetical protein